ncbi:MFS transporter [Sphaerisporangium rubeum]|uniref:Putative MFS family arabinose efflux permease n=1 Tax=Sphaerisporangium rubeum TaxID=321317 RepID=A0A7X0M8F6_9ACTN|nr:MFS transporter [Sphaerisporangium rubeum]MBB6473826.1 putative MFS family arabinose efflux permease [Sphaerisporangium rubeum]
MPSPPPPAHDTPSATRWRGPAQPARPPAPTAAPPPPRRAATAVYLLFLTSGVAVGVWTARIPALKERLHLGEGELSVALLAIALGAFAGMQLAGHLVDRLGTATVMTPVASAQVLVLLLPAAMPGLAALVAALLLFGMVLGMLDVAMNANAVQVERARGRPMMSSFHAVFSIGGFLGAAHGGLFAHAGIGPQATFTAAAAALAVPVLLATRWALRAGPEPRSPGRRAGVRTREVLLLGVLAFCCFVGEGAAADWGSVYLREDLGGSPGFAAAAYAAFSITMTAGRLAGDRLAARFGPVALVRCCGVLAGAGLAAGLLAAHPVAAVAAFACFGAGLSCTVPQVFSAAGNRDPARAGQALARVAGLGYLGMLAGPVLIGAFSEIAGLPAALGIPAALALLVALTAGALRPAARDRGTAT